MIDWTQVVIALSSALIAVAVPVIGAWVKQHMDDKQAAADIQTALQNGLGAMQQAEQIRLSAHPLQMVIPGITPAMARGVQYVLDNAGPQLKRMGITPATVADKLEARLGVLNIHTNIATAASPAESPQPLAPVESPSLEPKP